MVSLQPPICDFGWKAAEFSLKGTDGVTYTLDDVRGPKGTLVMFICNHCPYVKAILGRLVHEGRALQEIGVGVIAVMSNNPGDYPEDSFDNMKTVAESNGFPFPYVIDASQGVARAYGAVCTPDFYGFNSDLELQYRGRLDASGKEPAPADTRRDLFEAMKLITETGRGPDDQTASIGCSIKWRD